jgi:regulator of protease activity HflC (stomatin/prohibitin superfamily)
MNDWIQHIRTAPTSKWLTRGVVIGAIVLGFLVLEGIESVGADQSCLLIRGGKIEDNWSSGLHWRFPILSDVACYRIARTTYEASLGQKGTGADFNDDPVEAHTSDGQDIDAAGFRIAFHIPLSTVDGEGDVIDEENLRTIYTQVGARNTNELVSSVIAFYARPEVRTVLQLHSSHELLQGDLTTISLEIANRLRPLYAARGVVLDDVLLSKPDFNETFDTRLQQREQAEADIEMEHQRALQAEQQNAARIDAANADATVTAIQSQAQGNQIVTSANAESTAIAVQIQAYGSTGEYLQAQQVEAMSNWPVQILGDGNAMPVIQISPVIVSPTP